jgi:hypothetical protein
MNRRRPPSQRGIEWSKHTAALSCLLDEQLEYGKISEREKCWRRQRFMNDLARAHSRAFGHVPPNLLRKKPR